MRKNTIPQLKDVLAQEMNKRGERGQQEQTILPAWIKALINLIEEKQTEAARIREMIEFQRENRETSIEFGRMDLADDSDFLIEKLFERLEALEGPCADWDALVA